MTPADEAHFIALWQHGLSHDAMARQLGIPPGTVKSRAHTLQQQGKIQPRPRGGASPRQKALARQGHRAGVSDGVSARTPLPAERGPSVRWNLHLSARLREQIKAMAAARELQDSQMVEELVWLALSLTEEEADG